MLRSAAYRLRRACPPARRLCDAAEGAPFVPVTSREFDHIRTRLDDRVAVVEIHRPRELNMLSETTLAEVADAVAGFDADPSVHAIVLTGSSRAFAAGSDVSEQLGHSGAASLRRAAAAAARGGALGEPVDRVAAARTPTIAAVSGLALGGGCELALAADIVIAAEDATFGTPHVQLGTIPGHGGTQRLARAVGKAKAMELVLTGRQMSAEEAERAGLVTRVAPKGEALEEATEVAKVIARHSAPVVEAAKECVNVAFETSLAEGCRFERRAMQATYELDDRKEGMKAFVDGRKPKFAHR